jgi:photosystem II stability/assembly factor-like uncharacterized protein
MLSRYTGTFICALLVLAGVPAAATVCVSGLGDGLGEVHLLPGNPDITVMLTPHNPPVVIPQQGGNFAYSMVVKNNEATAFGFEVWTAYTLPGGGSYGPVYGPARFKLPDGWAASKDLTQYVSGDMPPGIYTYTAYVGIYPDRIWASASFTFEKQSDSSGWYAQESGTSDVLSGVDFVDSDKGWVVGQNTVLHTTDGGDNWYPQDTPTYYGYYSVDFVDAQHGWIAGKHGTILHTDDGGQNWVEQDSGYSTGAYYFYGVHFVDENVGWVVGGYSDAFGDTAPIIVHTTDGGDTWETQLYGSNKPLLNAVFATDADTAWAVGDGSQILHTTDGGENWYPQDAGTGLYLSSVCFTDASTGWVASVRTSSVLRTTDGGDTWYSQPTGSGAGLESVFFTDANTGWAAGGDNDYGAILHTTDGGVTWHLQDTGDSQIFFDIYFNDSNHGWAVGWDGEILHTETGGE